MNDVSKFCDVYKRLAIVKDPRYEQAKIVTNSKGANMLNLFRKKVQEETVEVDNSAELEIEGVRVPISKAIEAYNALNAKANAMKDDDVVKVNGKDVSIKELKNAYMSECKRKNAQEKGEKAGDQEEAIEKEKEEGKERDASKSKKNAKEDEEKEDKKDAENEADEDDKKDKEAKNSADEKGKHLKEFEKVAEMRNNDPQFPIVNTMTDRLALGKSRYGKVKEAA